MVLGVRDGPGHLRQNGTEVGVAFGDGSTQTLPAALAVARTNASPRREVSGRGKDAHVHANLSNDHGCGGRLNAWNTLSQSALLLVGVQVRLDLFKQLRQRGIQKIDMRQDMCQ